MCYIFRLIGYFEQYMEYDPFFTQPELTNPWVTDNPEMWEQEKLAYVYIIATQRQKFTQYSANFNECYVCFTDV